MTDNLKNNGKSKGKKGKVMGIVNQTEPERDAFYATPCRERGSIPRHPRSWQ